MEQANDGGDDVARKNKVSKGEEAIHQVLTERHRETQRQHHSVCWNCGEAGHMRTHCPNPVSHQYGIVVSAHHLQSERQRDREQEIRRQLAQKQQTAFSKEVAQDWRDREAEVAFLSLRDDEKVKEGERGRQARSLPSGNSNETAAIIRRAMNKR